MVCASEVFQWFKDLAAHSRIEFACSLVQLCGPSELRFISLILEDMNSKDYPSLRDIEERCNSPSEFCQYQQGELNSENVSKLCLSLSLLKPTNQILAQSIYEILRIHFHFVCQCVLLHNDIKNDVMLLYALASYHPAFTFNCRHKIAEYFTTLLGIYNDGNMSTAPNCNNSALKETSVNFRFVPSVSDVIIDKADATIVLKVTLLHRKKKYVTKRHCHYSQIKEMICSVFSSEHEFPRTLVTLSTNGYFTVTNIRDRVSKIIEFAFRAESSNSDANHIKDFFLNLPILRCFDENAKDFQKCNSDDDCKSKTPDSTPNVFQRNIHDAANLAPSYQGQQSSNSDCVSAVVTNGQSLDTNACSVSIQPEKSNPEVFEIPIHNTPDQNSVNNCQKHESENVSIDNRYTNQNLYPLTILSQQCPIYRFIIPNYQLFLQSKPSTSSSSGVISSNNSPTFPISPSVKETVTTVNSQITHQYLSDSSLISSQCLPVQTFIPFNVNQQSFTPLQFFCPAQNSCYHVNEPFPSILSHVSPSFSFSNNVNRPQSTTMPPTQTHIRQKTMQHLSDSSPQS